jgi:hypothetical protein
MGSSITTHEDIEVLLARLGRRRLRLATEDEGPPPLTLAWPGLSDVLPDGGLPRGVVELTAPRALGGATSVALAAVRAGQARALTAWSAWVDPEATLHAPGVVAAGVDLVRMRVVHPPRAELGRIALKVVASGAFEVVVIDFDPVWGGASSPPAPATVRPPAPATARRPTGAKPGPPEVLVRKLALAAEPSGVTVLILTDSTRPRAAVWPVALRLELARPSRHDLSVRIAKDRRGRVGLAKTVPFYPVHHTTAAG